jgi:hypothetical protein
MRTKTIIAGFLFALVGAALPQAIFAADSAPKTQVTAQDLQAPPDATLDFKGTQVKLIVGGSGGKGVLHFQGKDYAFTAKGVSLGGIGITEVEGTGTVHRLTKVEDFAGKYNAIGIGAALVAGKGASTFENSKGVVISTKAKATGLALNLGISSVDVTLSK